MGQLGSVALGKACRPLRLQMITRSLVRSAKCSCFLWCTEPLFLPCALCFPPPQPIGQLISTVGCGACSSSSFAIRVLKGGQCLVSSSRGFCSSGAGGRLKGALGGILPTWFGHLPAGQGVLSPPPLNSCLKAGWCAQPVAWRN